ncbi:hypothetical protein QTP88_019863 [Uroleucon formosanum]
MELLKAQQNSNRPSNDISIAPDLNKSIPIFNGVVMMGDRWKQMSRRVLVGNENVREYYHEKIFLCQQIGMSFYESKMQILEGLYLKELSMYLLGRNHVDKDDLLSDMVEYERPVLYDFSKQQVLKKSCYKKRLRQVQPML